jgi:hypothetical protein
MFEFTDKKSVFYDKYFGKFDTPKKLNRSYKNVPSEFIDSIENGNVSSYDIKQIEKLFPVFTYKSCITIHGNIPDIKRTYIGGYKNIIQNANGSLEIRWSAIDYKAKTEIRNYFRFSEIWRTSENSTNGIYFEKTLKAETRDEAIKTLQDERAKIEGLNIEGLTAKMFVQGYSYFGRFYIITTILPYSITGSPLIIASQLTGISEIELTKKLEMQNKEYEARLKAHKVLEAAKDEAKVMAELMVSKLRKTTIVANIGSIYVCPTITTSNKPAVRFYKIDGKGTFGRVVVSSYLSDKLEVEMDKFQPIMKGKQIKVSEITTKETYSL